MASPLAVTVDTVRTLTRRRRGALLAVASVIAIYTLAGFFFLPWMIGKIATETVRERFDAELTFDDVAFNPYALSLRIDGTRFDTPGGEPLLTVDRFFVNFQLSSLFRLAWTFDELHIDAPHLYLDRDDDGGLNAGFLAEPVGADPAPVADDDGGGVPRLIVFDFAVSDAVIDWLDELPPEPVSTRFGPVSVSIVELNTLPQRPGEQAVVIATETQGTLTWSGSLQLNPFRSIGHAEIDGSHFPLISAYLRHDIGFDIVRGDADLELDYLLEVREDGSFLANLDNLHVAISDLLVLTFDAGESPDDAVSREVLALPLLEVADGRFRWSEREVSVGSIDVNDARLSLYRGADGELNVVRAPAASAVEGADPVERTAPAPADDAWTVSLQRFSINRARVDFADDSVTPRAELGADDVDLVVSDISNAEDAAFPTAMLFDLRAGGTVTTEGSVTVFPAPVADLNIEVIDASLALLQPYIQPLADVSLDSGTLNLSASLRHDSGNPLRFAGDAAIADFLITETEEGSRLGSWSRFELNGMAFDLGAGTLDIAGVRIEEPYADILIDESGGVNLGRVDKGDPIPGNQPAVDTDSADSEGARSPLAVSVGGVEIRAGSARFADLSLPLPFEAEISALDGSISTIATASEQPAEIALEGTVDEYGLVRVSGTVTPLELPRNTDLSVVFRNVEMPKMSSYTIPFAGREIAGGRLDLDLGYRFENGQMRGQNNIVLREFELGDKVPHPGAMSLPLGLAVALLKDPAGTIDIDLPVSGDVNDPEFSYGGVVLKALANLILRIAASPFALIGNLLGIEASELEYIEFEYGRSDLAPPQQERIAKLAEALAMRPQLRLEIPPVVDAGYDAAALRAARLDAVIEARLGGAANGNQPVTERRREVLETLFREAAADDANDAIENDLEALRLRFTEPAGGEGGEGGDGSEPSAFDAVAYAAELRRQLIPKQPLGEQALDDLAARRAEAVRLGMIAIDPALAARVVVTEPEIVATDGEEGVRAQVTLTAED